jgi:hypothetical protein
VPRGGVSAGETIQRRTFLTECRDPATLRPMTNRGLGTNPGASVDAANPALAGRLLFGVWVVPCGIDALSAVALLACALLGPRDTRLLLWSVLQVGLIFCQALILVPVGRRLLRAQPALEATVSTATTYCLSLLALATLSTASACALLRLSNIYF